MSLLFPITVNALSATTANTIQGTTPRLSSTLEQSIKTLQDFPLFGVKYNGADYFTQSDLDKALTDSGLSLRTTPIKNITLTPAFAVPTATDAIDNDGDTFGAGSLNEKTASAVTLQWYAKNSSGTESLLTTSQKDQSFCDLAASNLSVFVKITGPVTLKTLYGDPIKQDYPDTKLGITQTPIRKFTLGMDGGICYVFSSVRSGTGPADMWLPSPTSAFKVISTTNYNLNFPTTAQQSNSFYLRLAGVDATTLTWAPVTVGNVTATPIVSWRYEVRVMFTGPVASSTAVGATALDAFPGGNQPFVIEGKDNNGITQVKYGFKLKNWYIERSRTKPIETFPASNMDNWCPALGDYRMPTINELSNANNTTIGWTNGYPGNGNNAIREIGGGYFSEWGELGLCSGNTPYGVPYSSSGYIMDGGVQKRLWVSTYQSGVGFSGRIDALVDSSGGGCGICVSN